MNEIFIELYLDEDVSVLIADLIRARGFSVTITHDAGNLGKAILSNLNMPLIKERFYSRTIA